MANCCFYKNNKKRIYLSLAGQTYDGFLENGRKWVRYERGIDRKGNCGKINGDRGDTVFELYNGATLKNVILGQNSIRYVNCFHSECTLENVWFENPCNDAIVLESWNSPLSKFYIKGGGVEMEEVISSNMIQQVLFILKIFLFQIQGNFIVLVKIVNMGIKIKEQFI